MINIILNEKKYVEDLLTNKVNSSNYGKDIYLISKYFFNLGYKPKQVKNEIIKYMETNCNNFLYEEWATPITKIIRKARLKSELFNINHIKITKKELDTINTVKGIRFQKVLFTLLCLSKYRNTINETNNNWCNYNIKDIFDLACVNINSKERNFMIYDLQKLGFIHLNNIVDSTNIRVDFISEDKTILKITDFRTLGYQYINYKKNNSYSPCKRCGKLFKTTKGRSLCNDCQRNTVYYERINNKTITCIDCGSEFIVEPSSRKLRCDTCQRKERSRINRENYNKCKNSD